MMLKTVAGRMSRVFLALAALCATVSVVSAHMQSAAGPRQAVVLDIDGAIGPPTVRYIEREIGIASENGAELIVLRIDTPGGLMDSMKSIIKAMLATDTPVVTWVGPQGARSASAGLYIMYAADVSAMAPNTNTGSATPVEIGGSPAAPEPAAPSEDADEGDEATEDASSSEETTDNATEETAPPLANDAALREKIINDAVAYIRALAEESDRNGEWAEKAVREAANVPAREALELGVVELIADDLDDLMAQLDGIEVTKNGETRVLETTDIEIVEVAKNLAEIVLSFLADPNVAVILFSLGTTGIIIEMWNPGSILPGALGAFCLLLGFYSFQVLPFNGFGLALMGLGAVLVIIEAFTPSFGIAGTIGILTIAAGMYLLFPEQFRVSPGVIASVVGVFALFITAVFFAIAGSRSQGPLIGAEAIEKREGVVQEWDEKEGYVVVDGERWKARSDKPLEPGDRIKVVKIDGIELIVKRAAAGGLFA